MVVICCDFFTDSGCLSLLTKSEWQMIWAHVHRDEMPPTIPCTWVSSFQPPVRQISLEMVPCMFSECENFLARSTVASNEAILIPLLPDGSRTSPCKHHCGNLAAVAQICGWDKTSYRFWKKGATRARPLGLGHWDRNLPELRIRPAADASLMRYVNLII